MSVTLVLPTFERADAVADTLPSILAVEGVDEILVVQDGPGPETLRVLEACTDPRLRIITLPERVGVAGARNHGLAQARGEWVVFGEDDCRFPTDYVTTLLDVARAHDADIVGAPWIYTDGRPLDEVVARARAGAVDHIALDQVTSFPARDLETPFLCALALVRRSLHPTLRYDDGFRGNAFREETDFFVSAMRAGHRVVLTPRTHSWQARRWPGGARRSRAWIAWWSVRNTARFLRRHGEWLHERGYVDVGPGRATLRYAWRRAVDVVVSSAWIGARAAASAVGVERRPAWMRRGAA